MATTRAPRAAPSSAPDLDGVVDAPGPVVSGMDDDPEREWEADRLLRPDDDVAVAADEAVAPRGRPVVAVPAAGLARKRLAALHDLALVDELKLEIVGADGDGLGFALGDDADAEAAETAEGDD